MVEFQAIQNAGSSRQGWRNPEAQARRRARRDRSYERLMRQHDRLAREQGQTLRGAAMQAYAEARDRKTWARRAYRPGQSRFWRGS